MTLRQRVDAGLMHGGLPGFTNKLDIGSDSIYVQASWLDGKIVHLDVTLSRGSGTVYDDLPQSGVQAQLELKNYDLARSWVEESCRMASQLLELEGGVDTIIESWRGIRGFPSGVCPQLECIVPGPLHAVALLIEKKLPDWEALLKLEVEC
jgi:hypothetical protein